MFKKLIQFLFLHFVNSGGSHNCIQERGFTWCETTQKCQNDVIEPCLPITRECIYCLTEHFGDDTTCGAGCNIHLISEIQNIGLGTDDFGCLINQHSRWCPSLNRCIDTLNEDCRDDSIHSDHLCHDISCAMFCPNGFQEDENNCDICLCETISDDICPLEEQDCDQYTYVCPKVTEVTTCSEGGIIEHTTYQLSLLLKEHTDVKNIYAIYGDTFDNTRGSIMFIPPSYQHDNSLNSNIGGIDEELLQYQPSLRYDSWLTIGITDGDPQNLISSIGIDFDTWNDDTPLNIDNGAIFLVEPNEILSNSNEYIIGQLTIKNELETDLIIGVHGQRYETDEAWDEKNVIFHLKKSDDPPIHIPDKCLVWFNGCNYCNVNENGNQCIDPHCQFSGSSYCVTYNTGH